MLDFNGGLPGPEVRMRQQTARITLDNRLEGALVHWHGLRVPNRMDGSVLTQDVVIPGDRMFNSASRMPARIGITALPAYDQVSRDLFGASSSSKMRRLSTMTSLFSSSMSCWISQTYDEAFNQPRGRIGNTVTALVFNGTGKTTRRPSATASHKSLYRLGVPCRPDGLIGKIVALDGMPLAHLTLEPILLLRGKEPM